MSYLEQRLKEIEAQKKIEEQRRKASQTPAQLEPRLPISVSPSDRAALDNLCKDIEGVTPDQITSAIEEIEARRAATRLSKLDSVGMEAVFASGWSRVRYRYTRRENGSYEWRIVGVACRNRGWQAASVKLIASKKHAEAIQRKALADLDIKAV